MSLSATVVSLTVSRLHSPVKREVWMILYQFCGEFNQQQRFGGVGRTNAGETIVLLLGGPRGITAVLNF